jgi:hypothetical protein
MRKVFRAVGLAIVLASGLSMSVPVAQANAGLAPEDPQGRPAITFR